MTLSSFRFLNLLVIVFLLGLTSNLSAQQMMTISSDVSPDFLVRKILLDGSENLSVSNVAFTGHPLSVGAFENKSMYYLLKKGIILSTGRVEDALGPNNANNTGYSMHVPGNDQLERIATGETFDAAILSFDFTPVSDSISFNFIFASEEYPEYVNKQVNDIFAFFLEHIESGKVVNLAVFGNKKETVNVDNINARKNADLYIDNADWDPYNIMKWVDDPGRGELALTYQYDGFTTLMSAGSAVIPFDRYRISFAISDVGDDLFDSAVFLEQGSFTSKNRKRTKRQEYIIGKLQNDQIDQSVEIIEDDSTVKVRLYIQFDFDDDQIKSEQDKKLLDQIARMLRMQENIQVGIEGHTDNVGDFDYNDDLSGRRAFSVAQYLMDNGLDVDRMSARGFGATRPISENATKAGRDKNRRVDLVFK